jgi:hypothetical protein
MNEDEYNAAVGVGVLLFYFLFFVSGGWMLWNGTNDADMMMMMLLRMLRMMRMMMIKSCK